MQETRPPAIAAAAGGEGLLFLTDLQIRRGTEAMFFAYRGFTADPDRILAERGYGRAHHRALHFVGRRQGLTVSALLAVLGVTKQSLNRVLRTLAGDGLVESRVGRHDKRERNLYLTADGAMLEGVLNAAQHARMRAAYRRAGPEAVAGFRCVLEAMMDPEMRRQFELIANPAAHPADPMRVALSDSPAASRPAARANPAGPADQTRPFGRPGT